MYNEHNIKYYMLYKNVVVYKEEQVRSLTAYILTKLIFTYNGGGRGVCRFNLEVINQHKYK